MASNDATNANLPADRAMAALSLAYFLEGTHLREIGIIHAVLDGQIKKKLSSPHIENIPLPASGKSPVQARPIPAREEGRWPSSRTWAGDAVDAAAPARTGNGRASLDGS
jgi:hypothetical protein